MKFIETPIFTKKVKLLINDEEYRRLQTSLLVNPKDDKMKKEHFDELIESVNQASKIMHGEMKPSRIFHIEPSDVQSIRKQYKLTQTKFAKMLGISPSTLRNWEQGRREPTGAAKVLLQVAKKHPKAILDTVSHI